MSIIEFKHNRICGFFLLKDFFFSKDINKDFIRCIRISFKSVFHLGFMSFFPEGFYFFFSAKTVDQALTLNFKLQTVVKYGITISVLAIRVSALA
jgi:hypothetical protein